MRKFMINVNGKSYEVDVEEITGGAAPVAMAAPAVPATPANPAAPAAAPAPAASGAAGAVSVTAPMPGTVLQVKVKVGDAVKSGQAVVVLEAMKMENEIVAPQDGTIASVNVSQGASVNTGDVLVTLN